MLDLHAKIRLSVAAVLVIAVSWFLPEALVAPAAQPPHPRAVGLLPPAADPQTDESCPPGTATAEQCAALNRAAQAAAAARAQQSAHSTDQSSAPQTAQAEPALANAATPSATAPDTAQAHSSAAPASARRSKESTKAGAAKGADAGVLRMARAEATPLPPGPNAVPSPDAATVHPDTDEGVKPVPGSDAEALRSPAAEVGPNPGANNGAAVRPAPVPAAPAPHGATPAQPAPVQAGAQHVWSVQVGSYGSLTTAQRRAHELTANGFSAYVAQVKMGRHKVVYRVRSPAPDRDSALDLALKLRLAGYDVSLARPQ